MPLYEYQCDACGHRFEVIQKFSDAPDRRLSEVRRRRSEAAVVAGDSVQGLGLLHHRLRARRASPSRRSSRLGARATNESATAASKSTSRVEADRSRARPSRKSSQGGRKARRAEQPSASPTTSDRASRGSRGTAPPDRAASARSRPPPSGTRACCRCRGARRRSRRRRSAATSAGAAGRWSAESRPIDPSRSSSSAGKMSGVRM